MNYDGSFTCECNTGYELDSDGYICSGKFFYLNILFSQKDQGIFQQNICLKKNTSILHYNRISILLVKTEMF